MGAALLLGVTFWIFTVAVMFPDADEDLPEGLRTFDVLNGSLEAMQALITRYRRAAHPADVEMAIPRNSCGVLDFHRAPEMIELGYRTAVESLDRAGV